MSVFHRELRGNSALLSLIFLLPLAIDACISSAPAPTFASTSAQVAAGSDTPALSITVLDVGDGDAILISTSQGYAALIDGGPRKTQVRDVLKERAVSRLDLVINTHPHADHLTGLPAVLEEFPVGQVIDSGTVHYSKTYESYLAIVGQKGIPFVTPRNITRFKLGPARLDVPRPSVYFASERSDASPVNDSTPVIEVSCGAFSALLAASRQILEQYSALRVITAYFYSDPEAARERTYDEKNHPFATLDMGQTYAPKLTFFDSNRTLLVR